ncbi:hypothetical protein Hypma_014963 [Hypsizygus marmoreus]|uniref:Uncharacterized protein n=1 Tax=Hypsizygus marmoreus TaxID=39966 RepID=A0A369KAS4_HYPMA|nr:hypothetical protein Hypma_014963 [Hypsizygus marmoreus]
MPPPNPPPRDNPNSCSVPAAGLHLSTGIIPYSTSLSYILSNLSSMTLETLGLPIRRFVDSGRTEESFPEIWVLGEPLVVTYVLRRSVVKWTTGCFMDRYGRPLVPDIPLQT